MGYTESWDPWMSRQRQPVSCCAPRSGDPKREGHWDKTTECAEGLRALAGTVKRQACPQQCVFTPSTVTDQAPLCARPCPGEGGCGKEP